MRRKDALIALLAFWSANCAEVCSGRAKLAVLGTVSGEVASDRADNRGTFLAAETGTPLYDGDGVRTGSRATAVIILGVRGSLAVHEDTLIRLFATGSGGETSISVEAGDALLESATEGLFFRTEMGLARLEAGGQAQIFRDKSSLRIDLLVGTAVLERASGDPLRINAGQSISVDLGKAILEPLVAPIQPRDEAPDAGSTEKAADAGEVSPDNDDAGTDEDAGPQADETSDRSHRSSEGPFDLRVTGGGVTMRPEDAPDRAAYSVPSGQGRGAAGALLKVERGSAVEVGRGEALAKTRGASRIRLGAIDGPLFSIESGVAELGRRGSPSSTELQVPGGIVATTSKDGRAKIDVGRNGVAEITVTSGHVSLRSESGHADLGFGEIATMTKKGEILYSVQNPTRADFMIKAGESITGHDPLAPSAIGFDFSETCQDKEEGTLEMAAGSGSFSSTRMRARGRGHAILLVRPGSYRYRVRCTTPEGDDKGDTKPIFGKVLLLRDSARAKLPRSGATNTLDADGRRYTVLYQNLLPRFVFTWKKGPSGGEKGFLLHLRAQDGHDETLESRGPTLTVPWGRISEGDYLFWWEVPGSKLRSPETGLRLDFDNAAPAVYLRSPPVQLPRGAHDILFEGAVVAGAKVTLAGAPVTLDGHLRFSAVAQPNEEQDGIALRVEHPRSGLHYYLRKIPGGQR